MQKNQPFQHSDIFLKLSKPINPQTLAVPPLPLSFKLLSIVFYIGDDMLLFTVFSRFVLGMLFSAVLVKIKVIMSICIESFVAIHS